MLGDEPDCKMCKSPTTWAGCVSAPTFQIYRCAQCGHYTWVAGRPKVRAIEVPPVTVTSEQPQVQQQQQQQQPQSQSEPEDDDK